MLEGVSACAAELQFWALKSSPHHPTSFTLGEKGNPPDFVDVFLIFLTLCLLKEMFYMVHPKSRELLTVALALTALASTLFPRKVSSQVLIGQSLGEDEGSCPPSLPGP